jgi:hypothetical protein
MSLIETIKEYNKYEELDNSLYLYLTKLQEERSCYYNIEKIIEELHNNIEKNELGMMNRCTVCNIDIGINNPRQLCHKTYCPYE